METQALKELEHRYRQVSSQIRSLTPNSQKVELLVVTKGHGADALRHLYALGQNSFGENYAQELLAKSQELQDLSISWIFIGHLQSNKIRKIVQVASAIQTVGTLRQAEQIARAANECGKTPFPIWLEVNADQEGAKHGCPMNEVLDLAHAIQKLPELGLQGLMAIPPSRYQDTECLEIPDLYTQLRHLADRIGDQQLSLGMSGDLRLAIQAGSNLVRIGTAILGPRQV